MFDWEQEISKRLESLNLAPSREAVIVEELAQHLEDRYKDLLDAGLTEDCAYRAILAELDHGPQAHTAFGFVPLIVNVTDAPGANMMVTTA